MPTHPTSPSAPTESPAAAGLQPLIGLSPNTFPAEDRRFYKGKALQYGESSMAESVHDAGALPVLLYRAGDEADEALRVAAARYMDVCDGLVLTGGTDISPELYGEELADPRWAGDLIRDRWEIALYRAARAVNRPILGICRGVQLINVAEGGSLYQDLVTMRDGSMVHRSQELYDQLGHDVRFLGPSIVRDWFGAEAHYVNSIHHQGLKGVAEALDVVAEAPDGVVEAVVHRDADFVVGVQWHPEWMQDRESQRNPFRALVEAARACAER